MAAWGRNVTIYREGYSPGFFWFIAGGFVLVALTALIVFPLSPWHLVIVPINLGLATFYWRMGRMGVRLEERGVKVVHMFRTVRIPWARFRRFVVGPRPRDLLRKTGFVELTDGSMVWIQGMAPWFVLVTKFDDFAVDTMIAEMNRKAQKLKAAAGIAKAPA